MERDIAALNVQLSELDIGPYSKIDLWEVPLRTNAWIVNGRYEMITEKGLRIWVSREATIHTYVFIKVPVTLDLGLRCDVPEGTSVIQVCVAGDTRQIKISGKYSRIVYVGTYNLSMSGYISVCLKGISKTGTYFANVSHLVIPKRVDEDAISFINTEGPDTHWIRRCPSLPLWHKVPEGCYDHEFYYSEVMVPKGGDPVGAYIVPIGFSSGYFGMQVNTREERRILFTIWPSQTTYNPEGIIADNEVLLMRKGENVQVSTFGYGCSGAQSYLKYNWKPDVVYRFLVRGYPDPERPNFTIYSAFFSQKQVHDWKFIAEFRKRQIYGYLSDFYSFIEYFMIDETIDDLLKTFTNQWIRDKFGNWFKCPRKGFGMLNDFEAELETIGNRCHGLSLKHCGFSTESQNVFSEFVTDDQSYVPYMNLEDLVATPTDLIIELVNEYTSLEKKDSEMIEIALKYNAWISKEDGHPEVLGNNGIANWASENSLIYVIFFVRTSIRSDLYMRCRVPGGKSIIQMSFNDTVRDLEIEGDDYDNIFLGNFRFIGCGYVKIALKGCDKTGPIFGDISHILVPRTECSEKTIMFLSNPETSKDDRKGPALMLAYEIPERHVPDEYYYCEALIPKGSDVIGSNFVIIGFGGGYIGFRVKSKTERMAYFALFPCDVPNPMTYAFRDGKTLDMMLQKYNWSTDTVYKFSVQAFPFPGFMNVMYTAKCAVKGSDDWKLIGNLLLPKNGAYMSDFCSVLLNTDPEYGHLGRKVILQNQWVGKADGTLKEVSKCELLMKCDEKRVDFDAGVVKLGGDEGFYMQICGFFKGKINPHSTVERRKSEQELITRYK